MNEIDLLDSKVIPTNLFGNLYIKTTILNYDYPRCFIAINDSGSLYALLENQDKEDDFGWNVTEIKLEDLNCVNRGSKNIQSLFIGKKSYLLHFSNNCDVGNVTEVTEFTGKYSIEGDMIVKDFCDMDELFDFHGLQNASTLKNKSSISFILDSENSSKTSVVFQIINYLKNICKNLKNSIDILDSEFSVQHASTVITFQFENSNECTLLEFQDEKEKNNAGVIELGNLLSANEPEQILVQTNKIKVIDKYSKLIDTLNEETLLRPKVVLAVPKRDKVAAFNFNKNNYEKRKNIVKQAQEMHKLNNKTEEIAHKINGILTGILTGDRNQFSFKDVNGYIYSGTVDFSLVGNDSQFTVNGAIYEATINEIKVFNGQNQIKSSYKLLKLVKKEDLIKFEKTTLFQ